VVTPFEVKRGGGGRKGELQFLTVTKKEKKGRTSTFYFKRQRGGKRMAHNNLPVLVGGGEKNEISLPFFLLKKGGKGKKRTS